MVYIITGEINSGKTSKVLSIYKEKGVGDGFACLKTFRGCELLGYEIVRLSTGIKEPFICRKEYCKEGWKEAFRYGPFSFSQKGIDYAEHIIARILKSGISPLYIDEIGPIELQGRGFCNMLWKVLNTQRDLYVVVREFCVNEVISAFEINSYKIIHPQEKTKYVYCE